jgi:hypothetical protein
MKGGMTMDSVLYRTFEYYQAIARGRRGPFQAEKRPWSTIFNVTPKEGVSYLDVFVERLLEAAKNQTLREAYNRVPHPRIGGGFNLALYLEQKGISLEQSVGLVTGFPDTSIFKPHNGHHVWTRLVNYALERGNFPDALWDIAIDQGMVVASTKKGTTLPQQEYMRRFQQYPGVIQKAKEGLGYR